MVYLFLQTSVLLSLCAVVFFGIGWLAHRWIENKNPWRRPLSNPRRSEDSDGMEALQANLRELSEELSQRNLALETTRQALEDTERKWLEAAEKASDLENQLADKPQDLFIRTPIDESHSTEVRVLPENPEPAEASSTAGIASALREQLLNLESRLESLRIEHARSEIMVEEQKRIIEDQKQAAIQLQAKLHATESVAEARSEERQDTLDVERQKLDTDRQALTLERQQLDVQKQSLVVDRDHLETEKSQLQFEREKLESERQIFEEKVRGEQEAWAERIEGWDKQLAEASTPSEPVPLTLAPIKEIEEEPPVLKSTEIEDEILERMERLERQWGERAQLSVHQVEQLEEDLKKRLAHLEDTIQNLRAESEMALLAQLDFQTRASDGENAERRRWEDLEHELELRITQLERELQNVRQADELVSQIGDQVEAKLQEQLASLTSEVLEIKSSWVNQEEEFKTRDEQIIGNLDRLQDSLAKLGVRIAEEDSVPDSVLKEMEAIRGDILASVPNVGQTLTPIVEAETSSPSKAEIQDMRGRFERASGNLQTLLEEKDKTIRMLDEKLRAMAKKLDPSLVGKDDLELIKGIGPYIKRILEKEFGIYSFKQVAQLDRDEMEKISSRLFFKNKIEKEDWVGQAIELHQKKYDESLE